MEKLNFITKLEEIMKNWIREYSIHSYEENPGILIHELEAGGQIIIECHDHIDGKLRTKITIGNPETEQKLQFNFSLQKKNNIELNCLYIVETPASEETVELSYEIACGVFKDSRIIAYEMIMGENLLSEKDQQQVILCYRHEDINIVKAQSYDGKNVFLSCDKEDFLKYKERISQELDLVIATMAKLLLQKKALKSYQITPINRDTQK